MRIHSQALKSIDSRQKGKESKDGFGVSKGTDIRATVLDSSISKVRIMLENGRELSARTSVPFENFINEKLVFRVISDEGGLVIRPKLEEADIIRELDMKIGRLITSLGLADNDESREIIRDMMKLEIPVTKSNYKALSENLRALEILKTLDEYESSGLKSVVANAGEMELRELVKLVLAEGKGENLRCIFESLSLTSAGKEELLLMFKSGIKLSAQNVINMGSISDGSENMATVLEQLAETLAAADDEAEGFSQSEMKNKIEYNEIQHEKIKNQLVKLIDCALLDFSKEETPLILKKGGLDKIAEKLDELMQTTRERAGTENEFQALLGKLRLLSELGKEQGYFQLPLKGAHENHVAQLLVKRQRKRPPGENESYTALIAIGTSNIGNVACRISYSDSLGYDVEFRLEDERILRLFKARSRTIDMSLSELGEESVSTRYVVAAESEGGRELIARNGNTIQEMTNFDMWV